MSVGKTGFSASIISAIADRSAIYVTGKIVDIVSDEANKDKTYTVEDLKKLLQDSTKETMSDMAELLQTMSSMGDIANG